jgi:hypothetical protein
MNMNRFESLARRARAVGSAVVSIGLAFVLTTAVAQAPVAEGGAAPAYSPAELEGLVGKIALYPDDLVGIILPAATSPLQIVQADRWLDKRKSDPKLPIDDKWDDPVKTLCNYPDVVKMMSNDLDWTSALGEAVVADQSAVLDAVQAFRRKAKSAGNLKTDDKQVVKAEQETIIIEPADPQVIYVPQYNPQTVVVYSSAPVYAYYPTPYPSYYYPYPPGYGFAAGLVWGAAIGAAWGGNHYGCCGDTNININKNVDRSNTRVNTGGRQQGGTAWKSDKKPGQVSNSVGKKNPTTARAGDSRGGAGGSAGAGRTGPSAGQTGGPGAGGGSTGRPSGGADRSPSASVQPAGGGGGRGGGDAFSGYGGSSGRQTQMDSSRGASSRDYSGGRSGASASTASRGGGGASRGGGGGGGGRGGGGGGRR